MDLKQIEKLMAAMEQMNIKRVSIKREGFEVEIEKECSREYQALASFAPPMPVYSPPPPVHPHETKPKTSDHHHPHPAKEMEKVREGIFVTSPMVGTFYSSPSPEDPAYVKIGDVVDNGSIVCIIEAMKVMNEVKAGVKGTIAEILLKSGEPVEFGTPIFRIVS